MIDEQNAARPDGRPALDDVAGAAVRAPAVAAALGGGPLDVIETHAARVLVGATHALKIKRPVRYAYLDFSDAERRRAALQRELELNKPHAPEIYLRLVRLTRTADGLLDIDGDGATVEHALLMRRFEQSDVLARRLGAGALPHALSTALGDMVASYHAAAPSDRSIDARARMSALIAEIAGGLAAEAAVLGADGSELWRRTATRTAATLGRLLATRARTGHMRRCHGDLHAGNIVLWRGSPVPFDALEFDEALATIDTLYDLAFLVMDLDECSHRAEANAVFNRYLWRTGSTSDLDALAALPLFLSLRAAIRAMVGAQRCRLVTGLPRERDAEAARHYLGTAVRYLEDGGRPRVVAIGGLSGTGKSTLGAALAPSIGRAPGALHLRSDLERKAMFHVEETTRLPAATYTKASSDAVYGRLLDRADHALGAGQSVIIDAVWLAADEQEAARQLARLHGARFDGLWLTAPLDVLRARVSARVGDASDATADVVSGQAAAPANVAGWLQLDAGHDAATTLAAARAALGLG